MSGEVHVATPDASQVESAGSEEPRAQRRVRGRRRARLYAVSVLLVALAGLLVILGSANTREVKLSWAVGSAGVSLAWVIIAAAVGGWLLGVTTAVVLRYRTRRRA